MQNISYPYVSSVSFGLPFYAGIISDISTDMLEYICGQNQCTASKCSGACTLRIRDLKPSDSAEYKFWILKAQTDWAYTGSPGVNLTVTGKLDNNILLMWPKWELVMIIIPLIPLMCVMGY